METLITTGRTVSVFGVNWESGPSSPFRGEHLKIMLQKEHTRMFMAVLLIITKITKMPFDHAAKSIVVSSYDGNLQS